MTKRALVLLAEGAEEMEVTITVDVLRRAGVDVVLAGLDGDAPVTCSRKVRLVPDAPLGAVTGPFDVVVLPGGAEGARRLGTSAAVGDLLRERESKGELVAAVCAAPAALAAHGVFAGRAVTSHPSVRDAVAAHGRRSDDRVVEDGALITSQGPGTTFEFALAIVRRLAGEAKAREIAAPLLLVGP
jgi:protein DJ-1